METLLLAYSRRLEETSCDFIRYLYKSVDWNERLIGIKGARGTGKTTMLLQHIKLDFPDKSKAFYVSLDNIWFADHTLLELTEYLYTHGVTHLFFDEVHRYPRWIQEIKNIYDSYPGLNVVFTGSSLLKIEGGIADLSRRARIYTLQGLSFREYLSINNVFNISSITLSEIISHHTDIASDISRHIKVIPLFEKYINFGYYPFFIETSSNDSYLERLQNVVSTVIDEDIPSVERIEYATLLKIKRLLMILARSVPFTPNITSLGTTLGCNRNQILVLFNILERAGLLRQLQSEKKNLKSLAKPDKILFNNSNIMFALNRNADIGTQRESFFSSMICINHTISYPSKGDIFVDQKYLFEIGGSNKHFNQIKDVPNSYIAIDNIEIGNFNRIPLWMFGLLY